MSTVFGFRIVKPQEGVSTWPEGPEEIAGWEYRELQFVEDPSSVYVTYGGNYYDLEVTDEVREVEFAWNLGERWFTAKCPALVAPDGWLVVTEEWFEEHCL